MPRVRQALRKVARGHGEVALLLLRQERVDERQGGVG